MLTNLLAALTGSASGGMTIALDALGATFMQIAAETGLDHALMHRVAVIGARTLDSLPHNGAVVTLLAVCGYTVYRKSYSSRRSGSSARCSPWWPVITLGTHVRFVRTGRPGVRLRGHTLWPDPTRHASPAPPAPPICARPAPGPHVGAAVAAQQEDQCLVVDPEQHDHHRARRTSAVEAVAVLAR